MTGKPGNSATNGRGMAGIGMILHMYLEDYPEHRETIERLTND
jgi:hypothetical protein